MRKALLALALLHLALPAAAGDIRAFARGSWQQLLEAHAGRAMIVHFWALSCAPCLAELPNWGTLLQERTGVDVVLIAADPVADEQKLTETVAKAGLSRAENWTFADAFVERLRYEVDPRWRGELPYTVLIGRDGRTTAMTGVADLAAVRTWIDRQQSP
jgi:thiol-disulfide isomerase/thioredoxin